MAVDDLMSMFAGGGGEATSSEPDINPVTGQPNSIPRAKPEPPDRRRKLVSDWTRKVKKAKRHWKPAFDRMREDQAFCFGKQWSKLPQDKRYVANLTLRLVAQKTAFLYAKNPKAVAKKRKRLNARPSTPKTSPTSQTTKRGAASAAPCRRTWQQKSKILAISWSHAQMRRAIPTAAARSCRPIAPAKRRTPFAMQMNAPLSATSPHNRA